MSTSNVQESKVVYLVIIIAVLNGLFFAATQEGPVPSTKPVGKFIRVTETQPNQQFLAAVDAQLKHQPSDEARLNYLAHQACDVLDAMERKHPNSNYTEQQEPILWKRFDALESRFKRLDDRADMGQRMIEYC